MFAVLNKVSKEGNRNTLVTDEYKPYKSVVDGKYYHLVINHKEFYSKGGIHTNNIESFWCTLKRGVYGIYHHISVKYMQRYVNEFCFRYNNRNFDMFDMVLGQARL